MEHNSLERCMLGRGLCRMLFRREFAKALTALTVCVCVCVC